jgi:hypothetical protein
VATQYLSSKWSGLNQNLLAALYPVGADGLQIDGSVVIAPATDGNIELTGNWQSPFEQSGVDGRAPAISQGLQTGVLDSYIEPILGKGSGDSLLSRLSSSLSEVSREGQGRSGMTKLNSTQVFTGAAPIKFPITLHFRAFDNPEREVHAPIDQLARWTLARELSVSGSIVSAIQNLSQGQGVLKALLPSLAPQMVALRYGRYTFAPLVIESMSHPITGPRTSDGALLNVSVQVALASLTALDQNDWARALNGQPTRLFSN